MLPQPHAIKGAWAGLTTHLPSDCSASNNCVQNIKLRLLVSNISALFNFQSLLLVILLLICTCAYVHDMFPSVLDRKKDGPMGVFWKCARIGERLSPYISICCVGMALSLMV
ncbi:hypothetical protein N8I77_006014 [Diaporthe amygdali]|uniref:Protein kish n=1 Tax=Phomopsis amygdali TaxID=1214568 RepID=A0AAD9SF35_PHOAM|nr:hypothetical protein N8I77_006014 [Diaporthe amygdali]